MNTRAVLLAVVLAVGTCWSAQSVQAGGYGHRQYYSSWSYNNSSSYYYTSYYYRPAVRSTSYSRHYCIYYPTRPRYIYYYNPVRRVYWGRYDIKEKGYSLLDKKDRKEKLKEIPESAFPSPSKMPEIPEAKDGERVEPIDLKTLPDVKKAEELPDA